MVRHRAIGAVGVLLLCGVLTLSLGEGTSAAQRRKKVPSRRVYVGTATWYGGRFHGRRTASGERFNRYANTLASRHLPFGTRVRVTNLRNGKSAIARVNDRGPFRGGHLVDLSEGLAARLGIKRSGVGRVRVEVLGRPKRGRRR